MHLDMILKNPQKVKLAYRHNEDKRRVQIERIQHCVSLQFPEYGPVMTVVTPILW